MKSKVANKILENTPQKTKDKAKNYAKSVRHGTFIEDPKCMNCNSSIAHEYLEGDYTVLICDNPICWEFLNDYTV